MKKPRTHKIHIAGGAETSGLSLDGVEKAKRVGKRLAKLGHTVVTGAHHGFPMFSAAGARAAGGAVVYFSPAASLHEHTDAYRLDADHADMIVYTGFGHSGAGLMAARSADAFIIGFGRPESLHDYAHALQHGKPVGILRGEWGAEEALQRLGGSGTHVPLVHDEDPERLVMRLIELIK